MRWRVRDCRECRVGGLRNANQRKKNQAGRTDGAARPAMRERPWPSRSRRCGDPAIRRSGDPAIRRSGDPAIRRSGDPAIRRSGDPAIRRSGLIIPDTPDDPVNPGLPVPSTAAETAAHTRRIEPMINSFVPDLYKTQAHALPGAHEPIRRPSTSPEDRTSSLACTRAHPCAPLSVRGDAWRHLAPVVHQAAVPVPRDLSAPQAHPQPAQCADTDRRQRGAEENRLRQGENSGQPRKRRRSAGMAQSS